MKRLLPLVVLSLTITITLTMSLFVSPLLADETKDYRWGYIDVNIEVREDSSLRITESQRYDFLVGTFSNAYRDIPLERVEGIDAVEVWEGDRQYRAVRAEETGGFQTETVNDNLRIRWWYPRTSGASRTFDLKYTVHGALRVYEGGDQLWWQAVFPDHSKVVDYARVTVHFPQPVTAEQLKLATYGTPASYEIIDERTVEFTGHNIMPGEMLEIRAQFPHGMTAASVPSWQAADDQRRELEAHRAETAAREGPMQNLITSVIGLAVVVFGLFGIFALWYNRGRERPVAKIGEYISKPPSDLPAGLVGTLIDEKADLKDVVAAIVELAQQGVIRIVEEETAAFLFVKRNDVVYELISRPQNLPKHQEMLIDALFAVSDRVALSELKNKFYRKLPAIRSQMYDEVVGQGFFAQNPNSVKLKYALMGVVLIVVAAAAGVASVMLAEYADTAICPGLGLGLLSLALIAISPSMPRRTNKGAEEKARWQAFRRYLESIEKHTDLKEAGDISQKYLAYAICFGIERGWVHKFAQAGAPAPDWYRPYPPVFVGGPVFHHGGYGPGHGHLWTEAAGNTGGSLGAPSMPSLGQASDGMFTSLSSISDGLFSALQSTASAISSTPSSSGSGGFSGGGSSGGGGGGGGGGGAG